MTLRFDRSLPPAAALVLLGALMAAGALLLPWYTLNEEAAKELLKSISAMFGDSGFLSEQGGNAMTAAVDAGAPQIVDEMQKELVGYKVFSAISVVLHLLAVGTGVLVGLKVWSGEGSVQQHRTELLGAAALICLRPVIAVLREPGKGDELPGVSVPDGLFSTGPGVFLAFLGAGLVVAGALMLREEASAPTEWAPAAAAPGGAFVPGAPPAAAPQVQPAAPAYAQPAQAYAPPAPPHAPSAAPAPSAYAPPAPAPTAYTQPAAAAPPSFGQPAPSYYTPGGAYGEEGPGTLDRDSRMVRPNDPYAPKPLAAPAVPIMPSPAAVTPVNDPAPVVDTPGAVYGVPAPAPAAPPQRPGSTAPPGFA